MRAATLLVVLGLTACNGGATRADATKAPEHEELPAGIAARVGQELIATASVERVAEAQGVDRAAARKLLIDDALFAAHAKSGGLDRALVEQVERAALARAVVERIGRQAQASGPPADSEVERITKLRWVDLDRPPAARTTHAAVLVKSDGDKQKARELAERIADAVRGARDATEFRKRAERVPKGSLDVRIEALPPVTPDGRTFVLEPRSRRGPLGSFDPDFAAAANAIEDVGDQSPIVETKFGYHVILLEEKLPEVRLSLDRRRELVTEEVIGARATRLQEEILARLRSQTRIELDRAGEMLTAEVRVVP